MEQGRFLFDVLFSASLDIFGALHHFGSLVSDISTVGTKTGIACADLGLLGFLRPVGCACCGILQAMDFFFVLFVFGKLPIILDLLFALPGGKIAFVNVDVLFIDDQNVIDTGIEKGTVV